MDLSRFNIQELRNNFLNAEPFNHIVIDNFLNEPYLNTILTEINSYTDAQWFDSDNASINNESDNIFQSKKVALTDYNKMGPLSKTFIDLTRSPTFLKFLENVTDIENIESDPYLYGGGIHRVSAGGRLSIHSDFNIHPKLNKFRRINVLLYLNKNWTPENKGELELWSKDMKQCVKSIAPIFNRMIIFRITDDAFHGHPEPWTPTNALPRLSFALYYYTDVRPEHEKSEFHWALWQQRPNIGF